jgi:glucose-1-phosphate cytidylyltransferase
MKVVLFCGGRGLRLREHSEAIPKPMVQIGYRPILWHVMRYYAHFGFRDFILCLGYRADAIKDYFLHYSEAVSNDFVLSEGGRRIDLLGSDIEDWRITFADTGLDTTIGERLRRVRHLLEGEDIFLANYGDTLTDAPLDQLVERFRASEAVASFLAIRPSGYPFRVLRTDGQDRVEALLRAGEADIWINGGYFMLRRAIFDVLEPGDELVEAPFARLIAAERLDAVRYEGFWGPLDTLRDLELLEGLAAGGRTPWTPWVQPPEPGNEPRPTEPGTIPLETVG